MTVQVPHKVNAGQKFQFVCPDQSVVELRCPTPYPKRGRFAWRWHGPGAPAPIDVKAPAGVNAGDVFATLLPDGRRVPVTCPRPLPPKGIFTVTPPPPHRASATTHSVRLLKTPLTQLTQGSVMGLTLADGNRVTAVVRGSQV